VYTYNTYTHIHTLYITWYIINIHTGDTGPATQTIYSTYIYIYSTYIINIHTGHTGPATQTSMRRRMKRTLNITTRTPPPPAEKMGLGQVGVGTGQGGWVGRLVLVWDWSTEVVRHMRAKEEKRGEGQEEGTQEVGRP